MQEEQIDGLKSGKKGHRRTHMVDEALKGLKTEARRTKIRQPGSLTGLSKTLVWSPFRLNVLFSPSPLSSVTQHYVPLEHQKLLSNFTDHLYVGRIKWNISVLPTQ